jgi:hypothetical protein
MEMTGLLIAAARGAEDKEGIWILFVIVGAVIGITLLIFLVISAREKKRTRQLETVVEEMGLNFQATGDEGLKGRLGSFPLFNVGRKQELKNLVLGDTSQANLALFDFRYVTGHGKHKKTRRQTVVAMEAPELEMPAFNMRPEGMWDKVGGIFGMQDIDFDEHPDFSSKFVLKGENEEQVRSYMDQELLDFFTEHPYLCCEGRPGAFLYYRRYKRVAPDAQLLQSFLEEGMVVFVALMERQARA